jgi:NAD(P)-dependent dehydrogenase (short-subunit alcohol dehydrogenase family)
MVQGVGDCSHGCRNSLGILLVSVGKLASLLCYAEFFRHHPQRKFFLTQAAAKAMKKRGGGAIVHTGSIWALQAIGATPSSAYSAANAGVHALVHNLALELAGDKIRINAVAPAVVETPLYSTFMTKEQVQKTLPNFNAFHPLRRNG